MGLEEAEDLIELGIEGIDKLAEKFFHKVPDKLVDPRTYTNVVRKKSHREKGRKGSGDADGDGDGDGDGDEGWRRGSEDFVRDDRRRSSGDFDDREGERMRRDYELARAEDPMGGGGGQERRRESRKDWERGALAGSAAGAGAGYEYDRDRDREYTTRRNSSPTPVDPRSSRSSYGYDRRPSSISASYSTPPQGYEYVVPPVPPAAAVYNYGNPQQSPRYVSMNDNQNGRFETVRDTSGYNYLPPQQVRRGSSLPPGERRSGRRRSGDWEDGREGRRKSEDRDRGNRNGNKSKRRNKSEERDSENAGKSTTEKVVFTLLGAAVGGLALNAAFERMDKKNDKKRHENDAGRVAGIAVGGRKGRRRTNG